MSSPDENGKAQSSSPSKSKGNFRGGYHHRNAPYSRRPPLRGSKDSNPRDNRHFHVRSDKESNAVDHDFMAKDRDLDLNPVKYQEKKFNGRCRLFVGNIPSDMTDDEFKKLFEPHGETAEAFLNASRGFGFIKMETRHKAENAQAALDGKPLKAGRHLRVKFAGHNAALRVKYLSQYISNEMLEKTFTMFGEVERAVVVVDDKGKSTGEGIVDFARRPSAMNALKRVTEGVFLMTSQPRPIAVELLEQIDECNGLPEVFLPKTPELLKDREKLPRFAQPGSFESDMGQKWKKLYQIYKAQEETLRRNFADEVAKLEVDQETALMEQHTLMLRQDIQRRQEELRMLEEQTQNEIKRRLEQKNKLASNSGMNQLDMKSHEEGRQRGPPDADLRRPEDILRRQMEMAKNSPNEPFFNMDRGSERPALAPPLQPPPIPPGVDRVRMGGLNMLGSFGSPALGGINNSGGLRMGILPRPPIPGTGHAPPLLMDPSASMRPQGMRFDAPQGLGHAGGNLFGLRPPANIGPSLMHGPSDSHGPGDRADAKRHRRN